MKLEDIAHLANVSKSAASLALNGKPGVSEKTRARVLKIAKENNYVPLRKHMKIDETKLKIRFVACTNENVITDDYDQLPFFKELLSYITTEVGNNHHILTSNNLSKNNLFNELVSLENANPSDGILLLGTNLTSTHIAPVNKYFKNLVVLDTQCSNLDCNTVTMNSYQGGLYATKFLLDMGHENIGYIKGLPRINNFYDRRRGFKDALKFNHLSPNKLPKFYLPAMDIKVISKNREQFSLFVEGLTAIFCENDYIAISAIKTLKNLGYRIPEDISVIGFDDIFECRVMSPELSTIHVPIKEIAKEAISMIENNTSGLKSKKQIFLNTRLVCRDSVKSLLSK
ncbi:LacI family DNA-binding transcriptional regulator [Vagococcus elongatus]|uniref:HTH lacI-type domain-containing protein n=1 Tax=Vagococcus elongatus TaxID=180344 RepID=A0A430AT76_9ENTE|nr:LacI family DNA-binding transcriptional regulator [Vagococcus elongatus]RSU11262.1 hypothetical protein CBF29_08110 [Vagococcus elongatus]